MLSMRMRRRARSRTEPTGGGGANGALAWGDSANGKLAGGYQFLGFFASPQGVIDMSDIASVGASGSVTGFVKHDGTLWVCGNNSGDGTVGNGLNDVNVLRPVHIAGGVPLYPRETLTYEKGAASWQQPQGPVGPLVGPVAAFAGGPGQGSFALLADGRVLAWGNGTTGQLGNGYDTPKIPVFFEREGQWPQYAPWYVQTAGPSLLAVKTAEEANGGAVSAGESAALMAAAAAHALTGVVAIAPFEKGCYFLDEHGELWFTGQVAGDNAQHNFAALDPIWAARPGGTAKAVGLAATRYGAVLLLADHTIRYVGVPMKNTDEGKGTGIRVLENPGLGKVVAVAKGEYTVLALKDNGRIWVWGSNRQGGLGLGRGPGEPAWEPVELPSLANVIAIFANGVKEGNGSNNGDVFAAVTSDHRLHMWGQSYTVGTGAGSKYLPWGVLGDGTSENRNAPILVPDVEGVQNVCVNSGHVLAVVAPGEAAAPTLSTTVNGDGTLTVSWQPPFTGLTGELPLWRPSEGWQVKVNGPTSSHSATLPPNTRSWTTPTALAAGDYEVRVVESSKTETPAIVGGASKTADEAGKLHIEWNAPGSPEPSWIVEVAREGEDWQRVPPEVPGADTSTTITIPPSKKGLTTRTVNVRVTGLFEGTYKTRIAFLTV